MDGTLPILVPLDGSAAAENALDFACLLAPIYGASLDVVYVVDPNENTASLEAASASFKTYGEGLIARRHLPADSRVRAVAGPAARTLIDIARDAKLVVMATHGRSGIRATFVGSVADKVVRSASSPVLLVPAIGPPAAVPGVIVVPLDGSRSSQRALPAARRLAEAFGSKLILLGAYNSFVAGDAEFGYYNVPLSLGEDVQSYLDSVAATGEETVTVDGDAATAIVSTASLRDAGLVVMTSSGKGLAGRIILGSTTDRVMRSLHRPLMIVRAGS